jgi:hypothetical protein
MNCTHNSLRPLKKGLISHYSESQPLPIGWHHLLHSVNDIDKKELKISYAQPTKRSFSHLFNEKPIDQCSQAILSLRQMLIA